MLRLNVLQTELSLQSDSRIRQLAREIFQKCLKGIVKISRCCPDCIYEDKENLASAITVIKLLQMATGAAILPDLPQSDKLEYGQLLSEDGEHEVLVWDSKEYSATQLFNKVKEGNC